MKVNAIISLFNVGFYPNEQRISLETDYIDWLVEATSIEIEEKRVLKESIDGLIDKETLLIVMNAK